MTATDLVLAAPTDLTADESISAALSEAKRSHVADEYADMAPRMVGRDRGEWAWVSGELRSGWRDPRNGEWLRHVSGPKEHGQQVSEREAT